MPRKEEMEDFFDIDMEELINIANDESDLTGYGKIVQSELDLGKWEEDGEIKFADVSSSSITPSTEKTEYRTDYDVDSDYRVSYDDVVRRPRKIATDVAPGDVVTQKEDPTKKPMTVTKTEPGSDVVEVETPEGTKKKVKKEYIEHMSSKFASFMEKYENNENWLYDYLEFRNTLNEFDSRIVMSIIKEASKKVAITTRERVELVKEMMEANPKNSYYFIHCLDSEVEDIYNEWVRMGKPENFDLESLYMKYTRGGRNYMKSLEKKKKQGSVKTAQTLGDMPSPNKPEEVSKTPKMDKPDVVVEEDKLEEEPEKRVEEKDVKEGKKEPDIGRMYKDFIMDILTDPEVAPRVVKKLLQKLEMDPELLMKLESLLPEIEDTPNFWKKSGIKVYSAIKTVYGRSDKPIYVGDDPEGFMYYFDPELGFVLQIKEMPDTYDMIAMDLNEFLASDICPIIKEKVKDLMDIE